MPSMPFLALIGTALEKAMNTTLIEVLVAIIIQDVKYCQFLASFGVECRALKSLKALLPLFRLFNTMAFSATSGVKKRYLND